MELDAQMKQAVDALRSARLVAVLSGAGMSRESGVPTFREAQTGLWAQYNPEALATPQAFQRDPDLVWSWYMWRYDLVTGVEPNAGHRAVAELEQLVPEMVVLTQNVDGLHHRAGSTDVVELHGNITRFRCYDDCQHNRTLIELNDLNYTRDKAPACPHCNARVRPDVVWFGESLPSAALTRALEIARQCDVMLVIGTSGIVQPAAALPLEARRAGALTIEVNPASSMLTRQLDIFLQGAAGVVLPSLLSALSRSINEE